MVSSLEKRRGLDYGSPAVTRLPEEILSSIFICCLAKDLSVQIPPTPTVTQQIGSQLPWTFTQVCSKWRQVAINDTRLWNRITLLDGAWDPPYHKMAQTVFARAGDVPLQLGVNFIEELGMFPLFQPHLHCVETLSLNISAMDMCTFLSMPAGLMPRLQNLELGIHELADSWVIPANPVRAFDASPHLQKLRVYGGGMYGDHDDFLLDLNAPWPQLIHLTCDTPISSQAAYYVLKQCANLISCTLSLTNNHFDYPEAQFRFPTDMVTVPCLKEFHAIFRFLECDCKLLERLILPSLSTFTCYTDQIHEWHPVHDLPPLVKRSGCSLHHLRLEGPGGARNDLAQILSCSPGLVSIETEHFSLNFSMVADMASGAFPWLERLQCWMDKGTADAFSNMAASRWPTFFNIRIKGVDVAFLENFTNRINAVGCSRVFLGTTEMRIAWSKNCI